MLDLLLLLLIAGFCGAIAKAITGLSRGGCLVSIALGFIGAFLGRYLQSVAKLPEPLTLRVRGAEFPVLWSIIGGVLFTALIVFLTGRKRSD